jgi:hypothetical protein
MLFKMLPGLLRSQESNVEGHSYFSKRLRVKSHLDRRSLPYSGIACMSARYESGKENSRRKIQSSLGSQEEIFSTFPSPALLL